MKKRFISLFSILVIVPYTFFATTSCTFEDIFDHVAEEQKKLDKDKGKNDSDEKIQEENYDFIITPQNVTGDFRKFFQSIADKHSNILIKDGTYDIELVNGDGVKPKDGSTITFEKNAKIRVKPNRLERYSVFDLRGRKNITIKNPNLEGDKYTHLGSTGQWGVGIYIVSCSNIVIHGGYITKFWGDGLCLANCENVKIFNPELIDNRRQGISIISCENVEIHSPIITNTSGHKPGYGIDIEPDWNGEHVKGLKIYEATFKNNGNDTYPVGFCLSTRMVKNINPNKSRSLIPTHFDIELINPTFYGDALLISTPGDLAYGKIIIKNPVFHNVKEIGMFFLNHQSDNFKTEIINPTLFNSVQSNKRSIYYAPILFDCNHYATKAVGNRNITIENPKIIADDKAIYKTSAIRNIVHSTSYKDDLKNVTIKNLEIRGYSTPFSNYNGTGKVDTYSNLSDSFTLTLNSKGSNLPSFSFFPWQASEVSKTLERALIDFRENIKDPIIYLNDNIPISGFELYYVNNSANKMPLNLNFGTKYTPKRKTVKRAGQVQHSSNGITIPHGSHVTLVKKGANTWEIVDTKSSKNIRY
ncbi:right-handed parallel beta-helix repeat-containing protein [Capnocytophaga stomatis]|uniref:Right-handed parallel beta-helix repeat-containing protein n=1 Tax=Capnocytophaga stomatis TaxID=1848904 RepID=A0ABW8QA68_9FLAO|nr:right-handed parallel beta-helix repeat-containing protein [Capnocytophaga stomatis]GIJ93915.1 hypothetical protein CAPN002_11330 [Capnocytophaga stomatis]